MRDDARLDGTGYTYEDVEALPLYLAPPPTALCGRALRLPADPHLHRPTYERLTPGWTSWPARAGTSPTRRRSRSSSALRVEARKHEVDLERFRGAYADERHVGRMVAEPCAVHIEGEEHPSAVYVDLEERLRRAVAALRRSVRDEAARAGCGRLAHVRVRAEADRAGARRCAGRRSWRRRLRRRRGDRRAGRGGRGHLPAAEPGAVRRARGTAAKVLPEWRLGGAACSRAGSSTATTSCRTMTTEGTSPSAGAACSSSSGRARGGELVCPELDLCFRLRDHSLFMFDGQAILHGVSPFRRDAPGRLPLLIVFDSLQQMWRCDPKDESVALAPRRRTERERARFR